MRRFTVPFVNLPGAETYLLCTVGARRGRSHRCKGITCQLLTPEAQKWREPASSLPRDRRAFTILLSARRIIIYNHTEKTADKTLLLMVKFTADAGDFGQLGKVSGWRCLCYAHLQKQAGDVFRK